MNTYPQNICENNHFFTGHEFSVYDIPNTTSIDVCPICGKPAIWTNWVENTNLYHYGYIPPELLEITPPIVTRTCTKNSEGFYEENVHTIVGTYKIPDDNNLRCYVQGDIIYNCLTEKIITTVRIPS
jgi:NMD protein affecting ribosome stability and mRNA decay